MTIQEILLEIREKKHCSQQALAKLLSVDQKTISRWERGLQKPDYDTLRKLCILFDLPSDYVLGLSDYGNESPLREKSDHKK